MPIRTLHQPLTEAPAGTRLGLAAVAVTVVLWASAFVGIRAVGASFSPGALSLGRLAIGAVVLSFLAVPKLKTLPRGWLTRRTLGAILAYGLMWFAGYNLALNAAERHLDAGTSAMLINVSPIIVAVLAGLILREGFPRWLIIGSLVAFCGVAVIALGSAGKSSVDLLGVGLCFLAALLAAVSVIVQKPVLKHVSAVHATWFGCIIGGVCCLPFAGDLLAQLAVAPAAGTLGLVYLGIFPTAIAFTTWAYGLARIEAGKLAATTYLVPACAILISWAVLGEVPTLWGLAGGAICLGGVAVTRRK